MTRCSMARVTCAGASPLAVAGPGHRDWGKCGVKVAHLKNSRRHWPRCKWGLGRGQLNAKSWLVCSRWDGMHVTWSPRDEIAK